MGRRFLTTLGFAALVAGASASANAAQVIYDSAGFEAGAGSPARFVPGTLTGQDGSTWIESGTTGSGGTATVESTVVASGAQAVRLDRTSADKRYWANRPDITPTSSPALQRYLNVDWDMNVTKTVNAAAPFGPFFGVESYDPNTKVISGVGVDASTGDVLYEAGGTGELTETGKTVPFGTFAHFQVQMDFTTHTSSLSVNGVVAATGIGFVDGSGITAFSDSDLSALSAEPEPPTQTGTAYFDNFKITTDSVPEPTTIGVLGLVSMILLPRRQRSMVK